MEKEAFQALAERYTSAVNVSAGSRVLLSYQSDEAKRLADACAALVLQKGGTAFLKDESAAALNDRLRHATRAAIARMGDEDFAFIKTIDIYIRIKDYDAFSALLIPDDIHKFYLLCMNAALRYRVNNTRWLVVTVPTPSFAQGCGMTLAEAEAFYLKACLMDYDSMAATVVPLTNRLKKGGHVHIKSPAQGTDLEFDLIGGKAKECVGQCNIPDGECYTAPVKDSVNGTIRFLSSLYEGKKFDFVELTFKDGRVVEVHAADEEQRKNILSFLNTDEGASYVGEFAFNFNPFIMKTTGKTLFDEKICGGIHLALGNAYSETSNGNVSAIHWDLVHLQRPEFGGGEIWIDDELIRKDGLFIPNDLQGLNPDRLIAAIRQPAAYGPRQPFTPAP
ncbi:MAG: aminopeptidase [Alphaproteobacteria bacterium]|nr:aminopeptidase [Alphaproteobacteria bacterium]